MYNLEHLSEEESWKLLRSIYPLSDDYQLDWLLLSTSGIHGSYNTLDDIKFDDSGKVINDDYNSPLITFLYIQPRRVNIKYGNLEIRSVEDINFLRDIVRKTVEYVSSSQQGNL